MHTLPEYHAQTIVIIIIIIMIPPPMQSLHAYPSCIKASPRRLANQCRDNDM
jgi:hypothetical protein